MRLVAAYSGEADLVLAQEGVRTEKHEGELSVAHRLPPEEIDLRDRVVTADALCARETYASRQWIGAGATWSW